MLKKIFLKGKAIPVPIPVLNLHEAIEWIESTLVPSGHLLTKIELDNDDLTDHIQDLDLKKIFLKPESILEVKIESPKDLALQTLESIYELCRCVYEKLKPVAVSCWQVTSRRPQPILNSVLQDIGLIIALTDHLIHLIDASRIEAAPVQGLVRLVIRANARLTELIKSRNWRDASALMLTQLEPLLKELIKESEALQMQIFAANSNLDRPLLQVGT